MPFTMNLWRIADEQLHEVPVVHLDFEKRLEQWIVDNPSILGLDLLIIGNQVLTEFGGRVDLLALTRDGETVVIELKRDRTPRDIVAQVLDYATWVKGLQYNDLDTIATKFLKKSLASAFVDFYGEPIPENVNATHSMMIVASELDESSERIVQYLAEEHGVSINAVYFNFFRFDDQEFLGRAWLIDPIELQERSEARRQAAWSGYWFVNVGEGPYRNWDDNVQYGFIGAGQGARFSAALKRLQPRDNIFAYMKGLGYVGYGEVTHEAVMIRDFLTLPEDKPLLYMPLEAARASENSDNPDLSEWVVGVNWIKVLSRERAKSFKGIFANQNIVCKLRHEPTVEYLLREFDVS